MKCERCERELEFLMEDEFNGTSQFICHHCQILFMTREFGEVRINIDLKDVDVLGNPERTTTQDLFEI